METLEIHLKDFLVKWVHVPEDSLIVWQVKPLKKSINFAVYRKKTASENGENGLESSNVESSLEVEKPRLRLGSVASVNQITELNSIRSKPRLATFSLNLLNSDLVLLKNHNKLVANELVKGTLEVGAGMVAFIFDNLFSKTVSKKVLFSTKIMPKAGEAVVMSNLPLQLTQNILMPKNGELMLSVLLKRRRKKLQGFVKRYFVLNFKYGTLSYFKTNDNKLRGQMPIIDSIVSANAKKREIFVDSGMEVWDLKPLSDADFKAWVQAFNTIKLHGQGEAKEHSGRSVSLAVELEKISQLLSLILQRLDEFSHERLDGKLEEVLRHLQLVARKQREAANNEVALVLLQSEFYDAQDDLDGVVIMDSSDRRAPLDDEDDDHVLEQLELDAELDQDLDELPAPDLLHLEDHPSSADMDQTLYPLPFEPVHRDADVPICTHEPPNILLFVRKNVGKDLSLILMPVDMNEPLTILQKYAEAFEYTELLDNAIDGSDPEHTGEKILRVAAFAASSLAAFRLKVRATRKPFNPLLGETYELVREDKGFRMISEKVLHKPPVFAMFVELDLWLISYAAAPLQKFWGKTYEITTKGIVRLTVKSSGEVFTWQNPTSLLKNIIAGEKYTEPLQPITVKLSSGERAVVEFAKGGMFSGRSEDLVIKAFDSRKKQFPDSVIGKWTDCMTLKTKNTEKVIWSAGKLLPQAEQKYGFTEFAGLLNKITPIEDGKLPPLDSRLRPDMRVYEAGNVEKAEVLKNKLEEDQRARRRVLQEKGTVHKPHFFTSAGGPPDSAEWSYISGPNSYWNRRKAQNWDNVEVMW